MAEPTWNLYKTSTPAGGPISAVGAGLTLWDGWIDEGGSKFDLSATNKLESVGAYYDVLIRPIGEILVDERWDWTIVEAQPAGNHGQWLRRHAGAGSTTDGYLVYHNVANQGFVMYKVSGGGLVGPLTWTSTSVGSGAGTPNIDWAVTYNSAHTYTLSARVWGAAPNTIRVVVTDVTAASVVADAILTETDANVAGAGNFGPSFSSSSLGSSGNVLLYNTASAVVFSGNASLATAALLGNGAPSILTVGALSVATALSEAILQYLRPSADVSTGAWTTDSGATTNLYASINESIPDDSNYVQGANQSTPDVYRLSLSAGVTPPFGPFTLRYRYDKVLPGGRRVDLLVELLQSDSVIQSWTHTDTPYGFAEADQVVTASITDYTALSLRSTSTQV